LRRKELLEKIKNIDSKITLLCDLKKKLTGQLDNLSQENTISIDSHPPLDFNEKQIPSDFSIADKINLFRSFFRGRDNVYARLWISKKTGKYGYSPLVSGY